MTDIFNTAAVQASGISAGHPLAVILSSRDDILIMTEQAYDATCLLYTSDAADE